MMKALDVARHIIWYQNGDINNFRLQRYLQLLQSYFLKNRECPLFEDEMIATKYGMIIPSVYYEFCSFIRLNIWKRCGKENKSSDMIIVENLCTQYNYISNKELVNLCLADISRNSMSNHKFNISDFRL